MAYAVFETILKPVNQHYRPKVKKKKKKESQHKCLAPYTEKINPNILPRWFVHSILADRDVLGPMEMYHGKYCAERFAEYIENYFNQLYATFLQQSMKELSHI